MAQPPAPVSTKVRVLTAVVLDGTMYQANDIALIANADLPAVVAAGSVDPNPDAVAYAESLAA